MRILLSMFASSIDDDNNITLYADAVNYYFDKFTKKLKIFYQSIIKHFKGYNIKIDKYIKRQVNTA